MSLLRPTISMIFAFLVIFSSSNFMVGLHICAGQIQNIALFGKADGCEKEKKLPACHRHESMPCCQDETIIHDADDFQANPVQLDFTSHATFEVIEPAVILSEVISSTAVSSPRYYNYDPPLRTCDLTVAFQSFLI